jgi:hypothetical protein
MKELKIFGLAVIAAATLMAFLGTGTASATVLCKTATNPCGAASHATEINATLVATTKVTDYTGAHTTGTCTGSFLEGNPANTGSATETVTLNISASQNNCGGESAPSWPPALEIHWISGTNDGTVTAAGENLTLVFFGSSCTYGDTHVGTLTSGKSPTLEIEVAPEKTSGGLFCPKTLARWEATYSVTEPSPIFVTEG